MERTTVGSVDTDIEPTVARNDRKLEGLQIMRGLAAIGVLVYHAYLQTSKLLPDFGVDSVPLIARLGHLGVDFFFVLSGFIICYVHHGDFGRPERAGSFLWKRFSRVWPLVWVAVAIKGFFLYLNRGETPDFEEVVNNLLLLPGPKLIGVSWTLSYEALFYGSFLGVIILGARAARWGGIVWCGLIVCACVSAPDVREPLRSLLNPYILQFFFGAVTALIFLRVSASCRFCWCLFGLLFSCVLVGALVHPLNATHREWVSATDPFLGRLYWGLVFSGVVFLVADCESIFRTIFLAPLVLIGNASFAVYLFHNEAITLLIQKGRNIAVETPINPGIWILYLICGSLGAGVAIHFLIEMPLLRGARKWFASRA